MWHSFNPSLLLKNGHLKWNPGLRGVGGNFELTSAKATTPPRPHKGTESAEERALACIKCKLKQRGREEEVRVLNCALSWCCQGGEYVLYMPHTRGLSSLSVKATMYQALLWESKIRKQIAAAFSSKRVSVGCCCFLVRGLVQLRERWLYHYQRGKNTY